MARGGGVGVVPRVSTAATYFFLPLYSVMQLRRSLGELINFKAGWVSKVNDLIIFPASLLRSQLSGGGKWGCGPLWRPRHVTVCVCVCVRVRVGILLPLCVFIQKQGFENREWEGRD